jgi:DNA polymerase
VLDVVTIDFETYYDKEYSLSKMTTENYVRDPRFEVIGLSIKINGAPTDWYSGDHPEKFLGSFDFSKRAILCHNTMFDGAILSWRFGIKPRLWLDTLSMARPFHASTIGVSLAKLAAHYKLGDKGSEVANNLGRHRRDFTKEQMDAYAAYCTQDTDLTYKLYNILKKKLPASELLLIDRTIRMYTEPAIFLDTDLLNSHLVAVRESKEALMAGASVLSRDELMSNPKFAAMLEALGVNPPRKVSKTTGQETFAFAKSDLAFTKLLNHEDDRVASLVAARLGVKSTIEETRTERLIGVAQRGSLPIMLNYYGAHTGRFSGGEKLNLQNLPRTGALRKSLIAPPGKVLIACDSAQIEARTLAWIAGQKDLVQAFRDKRDVYSEFATKVYGRKVTKANTTERHVGKTSILGLGYGMGAEKFRGTLEIGVGGPPVKIDEEEAHRIVQLYRFENVKIGQLWRRCSDALDSMQLGKTGEIIPGVVTYSGNSLILPNGMPLTYEGLTRQDGFMYVGDIGVFKDVIKRRILGEKVDYSKWTRIYGGKVVENITQALARIIVADQLVRISSRYHVVLQVHDEVVIVCDENEAEEAAKFMEEGMSTPPTWASDLPLACEYGIATRYGDC